MPRWKFSKEILVGLLKAAERAHARYEKRAGRRDKNWPSWYASYILKHLPKDGA